MARRVHNRRFRAVGIRLAVICAVIGILAAVASTYARHDAHAELDSRFDTAATIASRVVEGEIQAVVGVLDHLSGSFGARWPISERDFSAQLALSQTFGKIHSITSLAVAEVVQPAELEAFTASRKSAENPNFQVLTLGNDSTHAVITNLAGLTDLPVNPIGIDIAKIMPVHPKDLLADPDHPSTFIVEVVPEAVSVLGTVGIDQTTVNSNLNVRQLDLLVIRWIFDANHRPLGWLLCGARMSSTISSVWSEAGDESLGVSVDASDGKKQINMAQVSGSQAGAKEDAHLTRQRVVTAGDVGWTITIWSGERAKSPLGWMIWPFAVLLMLTAFAVEITRHRARGNVEVVQQQLGATQRRVETDALTGVLNREGLMSNLARVANDPNWCAVAFCDVDRFKMLNDALGHDQGDSLLVQLAQRLRSISSDLIISRFGGDEFVIIANGIHSEADAVDFGERILRTGREAFTLADRTYQTTLSVGVVMLSDSLCDPNVAVRSADIAMYQAKKSGGNTVVVFDDAMHQAVLDRVKLEEELREAIGTDQIEVHYQPLVTLDGKIAAVEALVRWNHGTRGLLSPGAFLDVAHEAGLTGLLSEQVLDRAVHDAKRWNDVYLSVNLAEQMISDSDFADRLHALLERHHFDPASLVLELSEELVLQRFDSKLHVLEQIRSLGVQLAIDDFGYGRSSLGLVGQLGLANIIKLDRSLIEGVIDDPSSRAIISSACHLATEMDLVVVAEGVETPEQLAALSDFNIGLIQGYLFARPMPSWRMTRLLGTTLVPNSDLASTADVVELTV